jgi:Cu+-exporting ATPase
MLQVLVGAPFYKQAWHGLKYGSANMGLLVALGTTAAFGDSLFSMALAAADASYQGHVYFESSVLILVFVCAGKYIEAKAKARTSDAVRGLLQLGAKSAVLLTLGPDGETVAGAREIPAELIKVSHKQTCLVHYVAAHREVICCVVPLHVGLKASCVSCV